MQFLLPRLTSGFMVPSVCMIITRSSGTGSSFRPPYPPTGVLSALGASSFGAVQGLSGTCLLKRHGRLRAVFSGQPGHFPVVAFEIQEFLCECPYEHSYPIDLFFQCCNAIFAGITAIWFPWRDCHPLFLSGSNP
jgi:hypothetical protein